MIRVAIADDHRIIREGLELLLADKEEISIVAHVENGLDVESMLKEHGPDVLLLDVKMPELNGLGVLAAIRDAQVDVAVVMLSMFGDPVYVSRAIELGASGYLLKNVGRDELIRAIETVASGRPYFQADVSGPLVSRIVANHEAPPGGDLSPVQLRALQLLADGADNATIATELQLSASGIKSLLQSTYRMLGVSRRSEAVAVSMRLGLIS